MFRFASFLVLAAIGSSYDPNPRLHRIEDAANLETSGSISAVLRAHTRGPFIGVGNGRIFGILIGWSFS